jgi:hypothetical protein
MPYFKNDDINILFIHIPKTGGTSIELYLSNKYNTPLDENSLCEYDFLTKKQKFHDDINTSLQHMSYLTIMKHADLFKIDDVNMYTFAVVRNPYDRAISDLFYSYPEINENSSPEEIYELLKLNIKQNIDGHTTPQYKFITMDDATILKDIHVFHMELLEFEMQNMGHHDFDFKKNCNKISVNYINMINEDSIKLINEYYLLDFKLFNYDMI